MINSRFLVPETTNRINGNRGIAADLFQICHGQTQVKRCCDGVWVMALSLGDAPDTHNIEESLKEKKKIRWNISSWWAQLNSNHLCRGFDFSVDLPEDFTFQALSNLNKLAECGEQSHFLTENAKNCLPLYFCRKSYNFIINLLLQKSIEPQFFAVHKVFLPDHAYNYTIHF